MAWRGAQSPAADGGALCARVQGEVWRRECYFQVAEIALRRGERPQAVALCMETGAFRDDCAQHLWQTPVHRLVARGPEFSRVMPDARRLYAEWDPLVGEVSDFRDRFWRRLYQDGFSAGRPPMDLSPCDALEAEEDRARCQHWGREVYLARLRGAARGPLRAALCESPDLAALGQRAPELAAADQPALAEALARTQGQLCASTNQDPGGR